MTCPKLKLECQLDHWSALLKINMNKLLSLPMLVWIFYLYRLYPIIIIMHSDSYFLHVKYH